MKLHPHILTCVAVLLGAGCVTAPSLFAQPVPVSTAPVAADPLDELVAPIALYPDALVAILLPAATSSSDVVLAARFLNANNRPDEIDTQPWDDSVKALAHYPDVIKWMDENLAWTQQLGAAYADQPSEVMAAIQRDRQRARANGVLVDTPQQRVVVEDGGYIRIVPAQADVIYVPRYEPEIVYVEQPTYYWGPDPWITFGVGFGVGWWLSYDCDWRSRCVWVDHDRRRYWNDRRHDWRYPNFPRHDSVVAHDSRWQPWRPAPGRPRPIYRPGEYASNHQNWQPRPIEGAPRMKIDRDRNRPPSSGFAGRTGPSIERDWSRQTGRPNGNSPRNQVVQPSTRTTVATAPIAPTQLQSTVQPNQPVAENGNRRWTDRRREPGLNNGGSRQSNPVQSPSAPSVQSQVPASAPTAATMPPTIHRAPVVPAQRDRIRQPPPGQGQNSAPVAAPIAAPATVQSRPVAVQAPGAGRGWNPPARQPAAAPSAPRPAPAVVQQTPAAQNSRAPQATSSRSEGRASRGDDRRQEH